MKKSIYLLFVAFITFTAFKSDKPAYLLFNKEGKKIKYEKMFKQIRDADVILFGESHYNPISHWLQYELTKDLHEHKGDSLILGAEMFESDNQVIMDEYMAGHISTSSFEKEARLWPNYKTDYKPLVEFAKKNELVFVASNVPRRYASLVNRKGFEGLEKLSDEAKSFLPPLPVKYDSTLNCYKSMMEMEGMGSHVTPNFPKAQAIKDATMAYHILKYWEPGKTLIHYHGSYHSRDYESIYWYLKQDNPDLKIATIHTASQDEVSKIEKENTGLADYTIVVDGDMTNTR